MIALVEEKCTGKTIVLLLAIPINIASKVTSQMTVCTRIFHCNTKIHLYCKWLYFHCLHKSNDIELSSKITISYLGFHTIVIVIQTKIIHQGLNNPGLT